MRVLVQKFGGTSLASTHLIRSAATRVARAVRDGWAVVAVVSAMDGETDRLLSLARATGSGSDRDHWREMDALLCTGEQVSASLTALAIRNCGVGARSLNARDLTIRTHGRDQTAQVRAIDTSGLWDILTKGHAAVVTGFQGVDEEGNLVTLGRGGSDTTAVALADATGAEFCEIFTDVAGVYTADPRICPRARKLDRISYEEMLELASSGAKVLQAQSVGLAMQGNVRVVVRSAFSEEEGTRIEPGIDASPRGAVTSIARDDEQAMITVMGLRKEPDLLARLFAPLSAEAIAIDLITHNEAEDGRVTVSFTAHVDLAEAALHSIGEAVVELGGRPAAIEREVSKVTAVGLGMRTCSGVAQRMFHTLSSEGIPIHLAVSTEIKTSCIVPRAFSTMAVRRLVGCFALEE